MSNFTLNPAWFTRKRMLVSALFLSLLMLCFAVLWFAKQNDALIRDYHKQNEMAAEQDKFEDLFFSIQTAESALRGYTATGEDRFMHGFPALIDSIRSHSRQLTTFQDLMHSSIDRNVFLQLNRLVKEKTELMQQAKKSCEKNECAAAMALITGRGAAITDSILLIHHNANAGMLASLNRSKTAFNSDNSKYYSIATWGLIASLIFTMIAVFQLLKGENKVEHVSNELMLEREHLGITLKSMSEGLVTTGNDGRIFYMNPAAEKLTGWRNQDAKHKPLEKVYDLVSESTGLPVDNIVKRVISGTRATAMHEHTILRCKADQRYISVMGSPLKDLEGNVLGAVLVFSDITEQIQNEEKTRKAIERYEILSKATSDTIWDWDIVNDSILYNNSMYQMFGYTKAEIENGGKWWRSNLHPDDYEHVSLLLDQEIKKGSETIQMEYRYRCADKTFKNILDRAYIVYNQEGNAVRMIGAMQDITKEKTHKRQMAIAITDTQEKERKELGMELHDNVNQLLGATLLYLGIALKSGKVQLEEASILKNCVGYINDAIQALRNLSHRLTPYAKEQVTLKKMIENLVEPVQRTGQYEVNLHVDAFTPGAVDNEIQTNIYRIIQEQLNNILKHAEASKIEISVWLTKKLIKLSITDNGKGFDMHALKNGIGLENMRRRAEMFSGKCQLKSSPGNGCELAAEMPLKANAEKPAKKTRITAIAS